MKHYMTLFAVIFLVHCGSVSAAGFRDTITYPLTITTSGDDAIVNAIKQYSNLTESDENSWKFSWVPVVGSNIHDRVMDKVRNYMRVCRGLLLANSYFNDARALMGWFASRNVIEVCKALDNLEKQGGHALALLGQVGTMGERMLYENELNRFVVNIKTNKNVMSHTCSAIEHEKSFRAQQDVNKARNTLEYNKAWWKTMALRWKMAKEMGTAAFNGAKWVAQTINENSAPLLSVGAMWFAYDKLFGTSRKPVVK
jgi:hypothetical protein